MTTLNLAIHNITQAAKEHRRMAEQCEALAPLVRAIDQRLEATMPVEEMRIALQALGLTIIHTETARQALQVVQTATASDSDELRMLRLLEERLIAATNTQSKQSG